jgi:diguanylate cyclase (GGDEF)-like protein
MIAMVYNDTAVMVVGTVMMVLISVIGHAVHGPAWLSLWGGAAVLLFVGRLYLRRAFLRRSPHDPPALWADRFAYGAWALGALWGMLALLISAGVDPFIQLMGLTVQSGLVIGAAVRNSAVPKAVIGQVYLTLTPLLLACLFSGQLPYQLYCVFVLLHMISGHEMAVTLSRRTARLLMTEEATQVANANLALANERLAALAKTDGLTGIVNRRGIDDALEREWRRAQRHNGTVSLAIFDIDHFKALNDTCGHVTGDDYLRQVANCLNSNAARTGDVVARYGGEEFVVLLADTDHFGAVRVAERLREAIEALGLPHPGSPFGVVTVSGGVVTAKASVLRPNGLLLEADRALYAAKSSGRNVIRVADVSLPRPVDRVSVSDGADR